MDEASLSHAKWDCKYHVAFIPKMRRKTLCGELRRHPGGVFKELARQRESRVEVPTAHSDLLATGAAATLPCSRGVHVAEKPREGVL